MPWSKRAPHNLQGALTLSALAAITGTVQQGQDQFHQLHPLFPASPLLPLRSSALKVDCIGAIGAIGALMNRVRQPRKMVALGLNAEMGTAAGADELVEVPYRDFRPGPKRTPFFYRRVLSRARRKEFDKNGQTIKVLKVIDYVDS